MGSEGCTTSNALKQVRCAFPQGCPVLQMLPVGFPLPHRPTLLTASYCKCRSSLPGSSPLRSPRAAGGAGPATSSRAALGQGRQEWRRNTQLPLPSVGGAAVCPTHYRRGRRRIVPGTHQGSLKKVRGLLSLAASLPRSPTRAPRDHLSINHSHLNP